jgi:DNA-binding response OmpR family regulator
MERGASARPALVRPMPMTTPSATRRILIVDDDAAIRKLLYVLFHRSGLAVDLAGDGGAALESLRGRTYDAIILDLMMPGTNGFEVIAALKNADDGCLARTIVLTAASDRVLREFADRGIVRRVMRKPFEIDELLREVLACASAPADWRATAHHAG